MKASSSVLLFALVCAVLGGGGFGFVLWRRSAANAKEIEAIAGEVAAATDRADVDRSELSRLMTAIERRPDRGTDRALVHAQARIEFARRRYDRAFALLESLVGSSEATGYDFRLAARIQLQRQASGSADRLPPEALLRQALGYAESAYERTHDPDDLLLAWEAAWRLPDQQVLDRYAQQLEQHPGTAAAELAAAAREFRLDMPEERLLAIRKGFVVPPLELDLMRAMVALQRGDAAHAQAVVEPLLDSAPELLEVRNTAATAYHLTASAAAGNEREQMLTRRDAQLDWLLKHAAPDDKRRAQWSTMRQAH